MQRREERSGTRQVALGLRNTRLFSEGIYVVRDNIENLIELSQRFGETTKTDIGIRVLGQQVNVARIEPLRSEEHTSELQSRSDLVCRLLLEKKNQLDR